MSFGVQSFEALCGAVDLHAAKSLCRWCRAAGRVGRAGVAGELRGLGGRGGGRLFVAGALVRSKGGAETYGQIVGSRSGV